MKQKLARDLNAGLPERSEGPHTINQALCKCALCDQSAYA
jgi:hypothetical protein